MADAERDVLETMREQVDAAYASAERLVREAEATARSHTDGTPPRGWAGPADEPRPSSAVEALQAIGGLIEMLRGAVPPELAQQMAEATRELLLALRALIDWYLERLDRGDPPPPAPRAVEDIPID